MAKTVEKKVTKMSRAEAFQFLKEAWQNVFGTVTDRQASIITAAWALETGNGNSMRNYNFGNIKGSDPKSGMSVTTKTIEGYGEAKREEVHSFRAYRDAEDGAEDYVKLIKDKYPDAAQSVIDGSPAGFVENLRAGGYFTGNPETYSSSVVRISKEIFESETGKSWGGSSEEEEEDDEASKSSKKKPSGIFVSLVERMCSAMTSAISEL